MKHGKSDTVLVCWRLKLSSVEYFIGLNQVFAISIRLSQSLYRRMLSP